MKHLSHPEPIFDPLNFPLSPIPNISLNHKESFQETKEISDLIQSEYGRKNNIKLAAIPEKLNERNSKYRPCQEIP